MMAKPEKLIWQALELGYDFVQLLPVRGAPTRGAVLRPVRYYERAWNAVPGLWHTLRHRPGGAGEPSGIMDWLLFPNKEECQRMTDAFLNQHIRFIDHEFNRRVDSWLRPVGGDFVEIHSGLRLTPAEIAAKCETESWRLCLDTLHLTDRKYGDYLGDSDEDALAAAETLAPYVDVVHVHPENAGDFIAAPFHDLAGQITRHLLCCVPNRRIDLIAEYNPGMKAFLCPRESDRLTAEFLRAMKAIAE
ncbi:MAG: hypothetical protein AAB360_04160 [Patescibacteria group bacterium]